MHKMGNTAPFSSFLEGGGNIGGVIRTINWVETPLGEPGTWPQSLLTTLSIILHSRFPMVLLWGPDSITFYNDAYSPVLALRDQHPHALGKPAREVWTNRWPEIKAKVDQVMAGGEAIWFEDAPIVTTRQGQDIELYWTGSYSHVLDETAQPAGVLVTCTDTTEKVLNLRRAFQSEQHLRDTVRERTADLQHSNRLLEQSNHDLQQFAHVASHDLKEPVRKIKIFSHRLETEYRDVVGPQGRTYLQKIAKSTTRIFEMINGILSYSSLPGTDQPLRPVDLNALLDTVESDLELLILEHAATIHRPGLPVIMAMPDPIYQLFYNLLNNALKFSRKNIPTRITITSDTTTVDNRRFTRIVVADNGIGFNNEYAETIFSTFKRLNSKDQYEGTGLGLSLCKKIVDRHGGSISAQGEKDHGARFTILLPEHS